MLEECPPSQVRFPSPLPSLDIPIGILQEDGDLSALSLLSPQHPTWGKHREPRERPLHCRGDWQFLFPGIWVPFPKEWRKRGRLSQEGLRRGG